MLDWIKVERVENHRESRKGYSYIKFFEINFSIVTSDYLSNSEILQKMIKINTEKNFINEDYVEIVPKKFISW